MKKTFRWMISLLLILILAACELEQKDLPTIVGATNQEVALGATFDPMAGVTAFDIDDQDLTDEVIVTGIENLLLDSQGRTSNTGTFTLIYSVTDSQNRTRTVNRVITVKVIEPEDPNLIGCPIITQGDYVLTWCDEFTGTGTNLNAFGVDLNKWAFQTGTGSQYGLTRWGNNEQQFYTQNNARVEDGRLIIEARRENMSGMSYTSARLWTQPTFAQKYGRFEARIRLPLGDGLWPAFWMLPVNSPYGTWARSGEIDIMEARGRIPNVATGAIHFGDVWPNNTYTSGNYNFPSGMNINQFHEYAIEWEEGIIRWFVNGMPYMTLTNWNSQGHPFPAPFDTEFYLLLNLAVGGTFDRNRLPDDSIFSEPVIMEVDYVRVYSKRTN
jgi:beta-glucanase (GH16 family)